MLMMSLLLLVLFLVAYMLCSAVNLNMSNSSYSCFECSFETSHSIINYSLQFFTLALSFIAFDFEIFLVLPFMGTNFHPGSGCMTMIMIISFLTLLLYVEMKYMLHNTKW